jgi:hypothetical protein
MADTGCPSAAEIGRLKSFIRSECASNNLRWRVDDRTAQYDPLVRLSAVYARIDDWAVTLDAARQDILAEHDRIVAANAPLDVERLARALIRATMDIGTPLPVFRSTNRVAAAIAKAYAALGEETGRG